MPLSMANQVVDYWIDEGLQNVRFTGGEPTLYPHLPALVLKCSMAGVKNVAISTNGSVARSKYIELLEFGANDFSISLDGGCCSVGDEMSGGIKGSWQKVVDNIRWLSSLSYVSVGMVFDKHNVDQAVEAVMFADSLGVNDIRVIPSAQYNQALLKLMELPLDIVQKYPILAYRIQNLLTSDTNHVRGMQEGDCKRCWLALDDMAIAGKWHFPCIIHLREGGDPVGEVGPNMRSAREKWIKGHNAFEDPICRKNCLDVCRAYNNVASRTHKE
jgi:molybdenum cofactor biosynthesis enzyme MoaA